MERAQIHREFVEKYSEPRMKEAIQVTPDVFVPIENALSVTFPSAYLEFITRYGPVFTPKLLDAIVTSRESGTKEETEVFDVKEFLEPTAIIESHRLNVSGGMEDWLVPVAMDCMGNSFGFKREKYSARPDDSPVFLFDHDFCQIIQVAESFDNWLAGFLGY